MNELKYTLKLISKNLRFSLLCTSIVVLGIATVLPFYSLVSNISPDEVPLPKGERWIVLEKSLINADQFETNFEYDNFHYQYFKNNASSLELISAWRNTTVSISDEEYSESFTGAELEPELLLATGAQPLLGRLFTIDDTAFDAEPVAIISFEIWQDYYIGREDIIGHSSLIGGESRTIIGVLPEGFGFPMWQHLWLPLSLGENPIQEQEREDLTLVGIIAENTSREESNTEISTLQSQILSSWEDDYSHIQSTQVVPYSRVTSGTTFGIEFLFALVLLLIVFNAANLFVVRGEERIEELAIRSAMGANHQKLAQALMLESLVVCLIGLIFGLALGSYFTTLLESMIIRFSPGFNDLFWWNMKITPNMIVEASVVTLLVWVTSGGLPAWRISRSSINDLITNGGKGVRGGGTSRASKILVNAQLILGCVMLTVGIFQILSFSRIETSTVNDSENTYAGYIRFSDQSVDTYQFESYIVNLNQALTSESGVTAVSFSSMIPTQGGRETPYEIEDLDLRTNEQYPRQYEISVSDNYFDMYGIEIFQGRDFGPEDSVNSLPVAIVDQRLVDSIWPDEQVIGKRIRLNPEADSEWLTVVGVASSQAQEGSLREGDLGTPVLYRPIFQAVPPNIAVSFRSNDPGFDYQRTLRIAASTVNRDVPISRIFSLIAEEELEEANRRFNRNFGAIFVLMATYLTAISTYGLAARTTTRRKIEMGIRMALGSIKSRCMAVILRDGFIMVITGLLIGGGLSILGVYAFIDALAPSSALKSFALNYLLTTTGLVALFMGSIVLVANYFPARKIVAMEPGEALHYE